MSATPKPIEWARGSYGSIRGAVGGTELFVVSALTDRSGRYTVSTTLPMYTSSVYGTEQLAKDAAERLLATFVARITA